ncbi:hypothetical protein [Virgisporangium aurantiacum]|uniref:Prevent-host-death family protein n=1 Tax=Virgisporangium aurantiacum TaxID=175570 RepID=A0A8J3ZEN1_9ACTN|nr:hypothetical protein [Virgisporangium aurantiacum]GIJ59903.1 hypothetical protein Vau01_074190 [Virgisporangium aurantiacum]
MSIAAEANISDLLQRPTATLERLKGRASRLLLHRRDGEDLVVTTASRYEQEREVLAAAVKMFRFLVRTDLETAADLMLEVFPWVQFLPPADGRAFVSEFVSVLHASEDLDNLTPVWQLVVEWKHTAEVFADPELLDVLRSEGEDLGPVPEPVVD